MLVWRNIQEQGLFFKFVLYMSQLKKRLKFYGINLYLLGTLIIEKLKVVNFLLFKHFLTSPKEKLITF